MTLYTLKLHDNKTNQDYKIKFLSDGKEKEKVPLTIIDLFTTNYYDNGKEIAFENKQSLINYFREVEKLPLSNDVDVKIVYLRNGLEKELEVAYGKNKDIKYFANVFYKYKLESQQYEDCNKRKDYYEGKIYTNNEWRKLVNLFFKMIMEQSDFRDYITNFNRYGGRYATRTFKRYIRDYYVTRNREDDDEIEVNNQTYVDIRRSLTSYKTLRGVCLAIDKYNQQIAYKEKPNPDINDNVKLTNYDDINEMIGGYTKIGELAEKLFAEGLLIDDIIRDYPDIAVKLGYIDESNEKGMRY